MLDCYLLLPRRGTSRADPAAFRVSAGAAAATSARLAATATARLELENFVANASPAGAQLTSKNLQALRRWRRRCLRAAPVLQRRQAEALEDVCGQRWLPAVPLAIRGRDACTREKRVNAWAGRGWC